MQTQTYDAVALFSGGLDSILAALLIQEQGLTVKCLHFVSPFFGKPHKVEHWQEIYGLDIEAIDIGDQFATLLNQRPPHRFGKVMNPCVDCKILMLGEAKARMDAYGASFIISGEVVGQRPMSQRRDALNLIRNQAEVKEVLLRPLCARRLDPTPVEESGLVDREKLGDMSGRGRKGQMELAKRYGLTEIPTPAGGCKLAEMESARRYWPVLTHAKPPTADDFHLSNLGRQYWAGPHWLVVGRDKGDNTRIFDLARPGDLLFKVQGFPGPVVLGRQFADTPWPREVIEDAAAYAASFSPKAVRSGKTIQVKVSTGSESIFLAVTPTRATPLGWSEPGWEQAKEEKKAEERLAQELQEKGQSLADS